MRANRAPAAPRLHCPRPAPQYLSYVLGWALPNTDFKANDNSAGRRGAARSGHDPEALRALGLAARADVALHERAEARLEEQLQAMGEDPRPALPREDGTLPELGSREYG